jgi:hypothetical protein
VQFNTDAVNKRKARAKAKDLGHDLVNFRKSRSTPHVDVTFCSKCYAYAFIEEDEVRGKAVTEVCFKKESK